MAENEIKCEEQPEGSPPNEAIFYVLPYLPLYELVVMSQVCRSLRDAAATDTLPWLKIAVDRPLNLRLSDDVLAGVTSRARGRLQALALINCVNITDAGLLRVVAQNPHISTLHMPGCTSLTPAGVITAVKQLTDNGQSLRSLSISGIHGIQKADLDTLHSLIHQSQGQHELFYHNYRKSSTLKHKRHIDVDVCPKCDQVRVVFDCPQALKCRGCDTCMTWCVECGVCLTVTGMEEEPEETSCADALCSACWLRLPKCSYCNKPSCTQHTGQQHSLPGCTAFLCADCHMKYSL